MTASSLERLRASSPDAVALAALASIAARVDRAVLRTLRIELLSDVGADATAEADLWMSNIVARRSTNDVVLRTDVLEALRGELAASTKLGAARALVRALHASSSPLLQLEEELIELGLTGGTETEIERRLGEAVAAMRGHTDRSADIAGWALTALPRLPARVRSTAAAWSLAFAAETESGYAVTLGVTTPASGIVVDSRVPRTDLSVSREGNHLVLGGPDGASMQVPATTPRVVMVGVGSGPSRVVTIEPGKIETLAIEPGDVVLTNLLGERWRVDTTEEPAPASESLGPQPENGRWIAVEGTDSFDLPPHQHALAMALGEALARAGFSLITLDRPGVSSVIAEAFVMALRTLGYPSGIYRAVLLVHDGAPDFSLRGRAVPLLGATVSNALFARADAILSIGRSDVTAEIATAAPQTGTPFAALLEGAASSGLAPVPPDEWTSKTTRQFVSETLTRFQSFFRIDAEPDAFADLLHLAAKALDQRDFADYQRIFASLSESAPSVVDPKSAHGLRGDARRPSYRLLGYCAYRGPLPLDELIIGLARERFVMQQFWETRTLRLVLEAIGRAEWSGNAEQARALAASGAVIRGELDVDFRIDPRSECRNLLQRVIPESEWTVRAAHLADLASRYATIRRTQKRSAQRTQEMEQLVNEVAKLFRAEPAAREASVWFTGGNSGQRIIALGLLLAAPDPQGYWIVEQAISLSQSSFEQYTALRIARELLAHLESAKLDSLREVLEVQRGGPPGKIARENRDRWTLSADLLDWIKKRTSPGRSQPS